MNCGSSSSASGNVQVQLMSMNPQQNHSDQVLVEGEHDDYDDVRAGGAKAFGDW